MKITTIRGRGAVIALVALALFFGTLAAVSISAVHAQMARIHAASLLLEAQALPGLSAERHHATARAYQNALHPAWKDLSTAEQVTRVAQIASELLTAPATDLPTPASFVGNRTGITTSQNAFALKRESDCSLTLVLGSYAYSGNVSSALTVTAAGTPASHYENVLHDQAGLSTTAGTFAGGCNDSRPGMGSHRTAYLGTTSTHLAVFAGVGYFPSAGDNALWFGSVDVVSGTLSTFKTDVTLPGIEKVAYGDLNGDGMDDIVGVDGLAPTISVWRVNTDGTLGAAAQYTLPGTQGEGAVVADFNGDGKADVIVASHDAALHEQISVFTGKGDGTLNAPQSFNVPTPAGFGTTAIETLIAADLRGNGHLDLIASNGTVLPGNGDGTFAAAITGFPALIATSSYGPNLVAADFNEDGKPDIAVSGGKDVQVFIGNGDRTFTAAGGYASIDSVGYLAATDLDGDGNLDLYVGLADGGFFGGDQFGAGRAYALLGKGDGSFQGAPTVPFLYTGTNVGDVNGDGIPDAVGVNADLSLTAYLGDAAGRFTASATFATSPATVGGSQVIVKDIDSVTLGDISGDGSPDIVYVGTLNQGSALFVAAGNGHGGFAPPTALVQPTFVQPGDFDISPRLFDLHLADVNGDGKLDLIYGFSDTSVNTGLFFVGTAIQRGNGNGTFSAPQTIPFYSNQAVTSLTAKVARVADLNKDTRPDLVIMSQTAQSSSTLGTVVALMQVALGNGDGTFATPVTVAGPDLMASPFTGNAYIPVVAADMNADGNIDLVALGCSSTGSLQLSVALGNGAGTFNAPILKTLSAQYLTGQGLGVADFDGDGKLDVAVTNPFGLYTSGIYLGNGDGTLQSSGATGSTYANANFVLSVGGATTTLDLNGDGKADILTGNTELLSQPAATGGGGGSGGGTADFAISTSAASGTASAGAQATTTITLTPSNGFNQSVAFNCSGLPAAATCSFSPASVTVNGGAATSTLTISTAARTAMGSSTSINPVLPASVILSPFAFLMIRRRVGHGATHLVSMLALVLVGTLILGGCGGGGNSDSSGGGSGPSGGGGNGPTGTPAGSYTITITGTAGTTVHTVTYALTVT